MISTTTSVDRINISDPSSFIPRWGKYCGPDWSDGKADPNIQIDKLRDGPVQKIVGPNGVYIDSKLDQACKDHDIAYAMASGQPDEAILIARADMELLTRLVNSYSSLEAIEKPYAAAAVMAFSLKLPYVDGLSIITDGIKSGIGKLIDGLIEFYSKENYLPLTSNDGANYSLTFDSEGSLVFGRQSDNQSIQVTLDREMESIKFSQALLDYNDVIAEESRLLIDLDSSITEITHYAYGVQNLNGVIVGSLTQEKLDQFSELGMLALELPSLPELSASAEESGDFAGWSWFDSLDMSFDPYALGEFDAWFAAADPILIAPYQWGRVDASLENFWNYGNDQTLAAYDLGSVFDELNWRTDFWAADWVQPNLDPWFSYASPETYSYFPEPVYYADAFGSTAGFGASSAWNFGYSSTAYAPAPDYFFSYIDPLVLKLGGGAVHTTNLSGSTVRFDMDGDGDRDKTGWITADHAFLVRDINKNGRIDNVSEMFSEKMSASASSGFAALAELDTKRNGRIDKNDKAFGDLRLWTDINANGVTDNGELHTLARFGIQSIDLNHIEDRNQYDNGNMVLSTTSYTGVRKGVVYTGEVAEVLFNFGDHAPVANVYLSDQAMAVRTADGKVIEVLNDPGVQKVNASLSGVNVLIGGAGDVLNAGNAGQSLLIGNGGAILNGNDGAVHFIVNGSQNIVNTGSGTSVIQVNGDVNTINASKGAVEIAVDGSRNKIAIGSRADVDLGGTANTLTAAGKSKDNEITVSGTGHVIHASHSDIVIEAQASVTLNGKNNDVSMMGDATLAGKASGGTLTVAGVANKASLSGAFIALTENAGLNLTGTKHQVVLAGDAELIMNSSGKGSILSVFGKPNTLAVSAASIVLDKQAELGLTGTGNKITLTGGAKLDVRGQGQVVDVYGTGNQVTVDRSKLIEHGFADLELIGMGNSLKVISDNSPAVAKEMRVLATTHQALQQAWKSFGNTVDTVLGADWRPPTDHASVVAELTGVSRLMPLVAELAIF